MIEVKNLTKEFKETKALDNVSLRFATGKIHGLIGRNGSGKTVLLKILCGFMAPTLGEVLLSLRDRGKTILLASHSKEDIAVLCDTVTEMEAGHAKRVGDVPEKAAR